MDPGPRDQVTAVLSAAAPRLFPSRPESFEPSMKTKLSPPFRLCGRGFLWLWLLVLVHGARAQSVTNNPDAAGLWMGDVVLDRVGGLAGPTNNPAKTAAPLQFRVLFHVDNAGKVKLLKDVIVAKRATPTLDVVLVNDPSRLASLNLERTAEQAVAGRRYSAIGYDFNGLDLGCRGGVGQGFRCEASVVLSNTAPTNPFRHAFHPDHANTGARAYTVRREIGISFNTPPQRLAEVDTLEGTYTEAVHGLALQPISVAGTVTLRRISRVAILNQ